MEPIKVSCENFPRTCGEVIAKVLKQLYPDPTANYSTDFAFDSDFPTDEIRKTLRYPIPQSIDIDGKPCSVIDIAPQLCMGLNLSFDNTKKSGNKKPLVAVCMQFYHEKVLFAKADWACPVSQTDQAHEHPQPHWHFEYTSKNENKTERNAKSKEGENMKSLSDHIIESTKQPSLQDVFDSISALRVEVSKQTSMDNEKDPFEVLERMHFAMIANWDKENATATIEMTEDGVRNWIRNCIMSVIKEHKTRNKVASAH